MLSYWLIMRRRYSADVWLKLFSKFGFAVSYVLRITHIALWLTIPAALWLWLIAAEPDSDRCAYHCCSFCHENILGVSFFTFLFIAVSLFLLGFAVFCSWIAGYCCEIGRRKLCGDDVLPPLGSAYIATGFVFLGASLRFWLPFIAAAVAAHKIRTSLYPRDFGSPAPEIFVLALALVIFSGYLVGTARFIAGGDLSLIWRRLENIDLALSKAGHSLLLASSLILAAKIGILVWTKLVQLMQRFEEIDLLVEAVVSSFAFFVLLLCWSIACSHLISRYARKIGIGDKLKDGERLS